MLIKTSSAALAAIILCCSFATAQQPRVRTQPPIKPTLRDLLGLRKYQETITDSSAFVVLDSVAFNGNRRTLAIAMLREMNVAIGDTIRLRDIPEILSRNQQLLYNTSLFNKVDGEYALRGRLVKFSFTVVERWFLLPTITFKVEERSVWEWLQNPNSYRTSYGAGLSWRNVTGRNDRLGLSFLTGYTEKYGLSYSRPFIWPKQKIGAGLSGYYQANKEVITGGTDGPVERTRSGRNTYVSAGGGIIFSKRITQNNGYNLSINYSYLFVSDSILQDNPRYLSQINRTQDQYPRIQFELWWDSRDVRAFPLSGHRISATTEVAGLGVGTYDFGRLNLRGFHYGSLPFKRFYWAAGGDIFWLWGKHTPYPEKGFLTQVRGFNSYVVDGTFFLSGRGEIRYELIKRQIVSVKWLPRQFEDFLTGVYPFAFLDAGYNNDASYNREPSYFRDRLLAGYGLGVDIPYLYDNLLRLEYVINNFGERQFLVNFSFALQ